MSCERTEKLRAKIKAELGCIFLEAYRKPFHRTKSLVDYLVGCMTEEQLKTIEIELKNEKLDSFGDVK